MKHSKSIASWTATVTLALLVSACGGGGGGSSDTSSSSSSSSGTSSSSSSSSSGSNLTLSGSLYAPITTQITLRNNGGDDLAVTVPTSTQQDYLEQPFSFATQIASGATYSISIASQPSNLTCSVFRGASGTMPATTLPYAGCEFTYDKVSRSSNDAVLGSYYDSSAVVIGGANEAIGTTADWYGEGRFVAFVSYAALEGTSGNYRQIFWRDRTTGETILVSHSTTSGEGDGNSFAPAISADGLSVAFESYATNLVSGDTNGTRDIFVWSALTGNVTRVNVGSGGVQANADSFDPTLSGDGKVVAFTTYATNLATGLNGDAQVVRRDLTSGTSVMVSTSTTSSAGNFGSGKPMLSEDGNKIAFWSFASNLVSGDTNGLWDIFVYTHSSGTKQRVSLTSSGGERNQGTESSSRVVSPAISGNGRYVAYATTASNVVSGDTNNWQDVFVVDTQTGAVTRASLSTAGAQGDYDSPIGQGERPSLSYDGSWIAFTTNATNLGVNYGNVVMHNMTTGETRGVSNGTTAGVGPAAMTRTSAYVAFGAAGALDSRFAGSGMFAAFTGLARAFFWPQD